MVSVRVCRLYFWTQYPAITLSIVLKSITVQGICQMIFTAEAVQRLVRTCWKQNHLSVPTLVFVSVPAARVHFLQTAQQAQAILRERYSFCIAESLRMAP